MNKAIYYTTQKDLYTQRQSTESLRDSMQMLSLAQLTFKQQSQGLKQNTKRMYCCC